SWFGFMAPANTPADVREKLNKAIHKIAAKPEIKEKLDSLGIVFDNNTPDEFGQFISDEINRWAEVVKQGNITVD
ncbi:MAG: tripartite tricarboxylate transporter substrate-binding protein, partial [Pelistega sp.]|nr:tripartite tricarboxylate transporter substrate-binding protein [Pelistega sp.]